MQGTPAGFPSGIPGREEEMDGTMQQTAQCLRQFIKKKEWIPTPEGMKMLKDYLLYFLG
jgi:hypothetical protein